jgi:hypothetical protein
VEGDTLERVRSCWSFKSASSLKRYRFSFGSKGPAAFVKAGPITADLFTAATIAADVITAGERMVFDRKWDGSDCSGTGWRGCGGWGVMDCIRWGRM